MTSREQAETTLRQDIEYAWEPWFNRDTVSRSQFSRAMRNAMAPTLIEQYKTAALVLLKQFIEVESIDMDELDELADKAMGDHAKYTGDLIADTTIKWVEDDENPSRAFSRDRAELIAITEITRARTQGEMAAAALLDEIDIPLVSRWWTADDEHVCPVCGPLHKTPEKYWREFFQNGTPAHPRCRCEIEWKEKAKRKSRRTKKVGRMSKRGRKSGFSRMRARSREDVREFAVLGTRWLEGGVGSGITGHRTFRAPKQYAGHDDEFESLAKKQLAVGNEMRKAKNLPAWNLDDMEVVELPLSEITPSQSGEDLYNESSKGLAKHIGKFGSSGRKEDYAPIIVDDQGVIMDGNHRFAARSMVGIKTIPVLRAKKSKAVKPETQKARASKPRVTKTKAVPDGLSTKDAVAKARADFAKAQSEGKDRATLLALKANVDKAKYAHSIASRKKKLQEGGKGSGITGHRTDKKPSTPRTKKVGPSVSIRSIEELIRELDYERSIVLDDDGKVLFKVDGNQTTITGFSKQQLKKLKGKTMTHNHPGGWKYPEDSPGRLGSSLSREDVALAVTKEVKEIRAVTPGYTHALRIDPSFVATEKAKYLSTANPKEAAEFKVIAGAMGDAQAVWTYSVGPKAREAEMRSRAKFDAVIKAAKTPAEKAHAEGFAESNHWHTVWSDVSTGFGWEYSRTPWTKK